MTILIPIAIIIIIITFIVYKSNIHNFIKLSTFTLTILTIILGINHYNNNLSKPINNMPKEKFIYVHHVITPDNQIILWTYSNNQHKLYKFPYEQNTALNLNQANTQTKNNITTIAEKQNNTIIIINNDTSINNNNIK